MPELRGFTHVSLSVRDLDASNAWYQSVLGLTTLVPPFVREGMYRETLLSVAGGRMALCLQQHLNNDGTEFSETRAGLDHIAFHVSSMADFAEWLTRFEEIGISFSREPDSDEWGAMAILRDPDNIQVELHCPRQN
jgi:catechol 2,3-dioxygenase-like lactoylglutathione lyase family enzyme